MAGEVCLAGATSITLVAPAIAAVIHSMVEAPRSVDVVLRVGSSLLSGHSKFRQLEPAAFIPLCCIYMRRPGRIASSTQIGRPVARRIGLSLGLKIRFPSNIRAGRMTLRSTPSFDGPLSACIRTWAVCFSATLCITLTLRKHACR